MENRIGHVLNKITSIVLLPQEFNHFGQLLYSK